jgi:cytochrome c peroxidase
MDVYATAVGATFDIDDAYNLAAKAIAAFERSAHIVPFNSKFDQFVAEQTKMNPAFDASTFGIEFDEDNACLEGEACRRYVGPGDDFTSKVFTVEEADGLALFNADSYRQFELDDSAVTNGGMCYACHPTANHYVPKEDEDGYAFVPKDDLGNPLVADGDYPPMFTDFTYDNLGIPVNLAIEALFGAAQPIDYGLGKVGENPLITGNSEYCKNRGVPADGNCETVKVNPDAIGLFKVPTLRNVGKSAPFGHNGFFADLKEIVEFYNAVDDDDPESTFVIPQAWKEPEVPGDTVNRGELGKLGLNDDQIAKIVKFMETLNDDFD